MRCGSAKNSKINDILWSTLKYIKLNYIVCMFLSLFQSWQALIFTKKISSQVWTTVTVPHWCRLTVSMDSCNKKMSANGRPCNCIFNIRSTRQFLYTIRRRASCSVCVYMWSTAISCSMLHLYHTPLLQDLLKVRKTVLSRKCNPCQLWV